MLLHTVDGFKALTSVVSGSCSWSSKGTKHVDDYTSDDKKDNAIAKIATWLARDGYCSFFTHEEYTRQG